MYDLATMTLETPGGHTATFTYRLDTNDADTLRATLDDDEYQLPQGLSGYALDVGGYLGSVGIALALDNPEMAVTIVEPVPPNADLIERNIAQNGLDERVALIRGAVGKGGERVDVGYAYSGSATGEHHAFVGNSTLAFDGDQELAHETVSYKALSLGSFGPVDFLKIDCEGGEWAAFQGTWTAATIVGESHAVDGKKGKDIVELLSKTHDVTLIGDGEGTCGFRAVQR